MIYYGAFNALKVTGEEETLVQFWEEIFDYPADQFGRRDYNKGMMFCFNSLVPVPDNLIYNGTDARSAWYRKHWGFAACGGYGDGEYYARWNDECSELLMAFGTPGVPPLAWVKAASNLFPDLNFSLYFEGDFPIYGQVSFSAGVVTGYDCASYESVKQWFEMFRSVDGFSFGDDETINERTAKEWMIAAIESELTLQAIPFDGKLKSKEVSDNGENSL